MNLILMISRFTIGFDPAGGDRLKLAYDISHNFTSDETRLRLTRSARINSDPDFTFRPGTTLDLTSEQRNLILEDLSK
jgi:hypothetical protein